jgi:SAM-dependent methyltransferase
VSALRPCVLCGAADPEVLEVCDAAFVSTLVFKGHEQAYSICQCRRCGLVYVGETVDDALLDELYGAEYYQGRDASGFADYGAQETKYRARFNLRLDRMRPWISGGRTLDVGCALGWFLAEAKAQGWDAEGVEMSEHAATFCREKHGVHVHTTRLEDAGLEPESFDLVSLWDTIEHVQEPRTILQTAFGLVKPGGYVVLSTGNWDAWRRRVQGQKWALLRPPKHLYYFTPTTLKTLVDQVGFTTVEVWQEPPGKIPAPIRALATRVSENAADIFGLLAVKPEAV